MPSPSSRPTSDQLVRQSLRLSKSLSLVALVFPIVTAVGWIFDIPLLTQGHPALPAMQPNTAVGLTAAALAVLLTPERPTMNWRTPIILFLTSAILLLGLLTLAEYGFGRDFGIDRILTHGVPSTSQPFPGRPSPQTSLNFVLLGVALVSWNLGVWFQLGQVAAIAAAANSIAAATGFIFSTRTLYGFPHVCVLDRNGGAHGDYVPAPGLRAPLPQAERRHDDPRHERDPQRSDRPADPRGQHRRAAVRRHADMARRRGRMV